MASRGHSMYIKDIPSPPIKLAGLILRRKEGRECGPSSRTSLPYKQDDYEVLLRRWTKTPYVGQLCMPSGPMVQGSSPEATLLNEAQGWTTKLAARAEMKKTKGLKGQRAVFLTACGEATSEDRAAPSVQDHTTTLCYIVPTTCEESSIVDGYPADGWYPRFHCLRGLLWQMYHKRAHVHHLTKQALAALDHCLREQHAVPNGISTLFTPSIVYQVKMTVINPLFQLGLMEEVEKKQRTTSTHSTPRRDNALPRDMSFDLSLMTFEEEEEEIFPEGTEGGDDGWLQGTEDKVDRVVLNPFFGQEVSLNYDKLQAVGVPESDQVQDEEGDSEWMLTYPVHKCACEGDSEGVRMALEGGHQVDEKDDNEWTALHYACWYGQVEVVEQLVEKGNASFNVANNNGSTPLHLAAGQGHSAVVAYLVTLKGIAKDMTDNDGQTPLDVCEMYKKEDWSECLELLREQDSASINVKKYKMASYVSRGMLRDKLPETTPELARKSAAPTNTKSERVCRVNLDSGQHRIVKLAKGEQTTGGEMITSILETLGVGSKLNSRFALWVVSPSLEIQLGDRDKPMDVISRWAGLVHHYGGEKTEEIPQLYLRANVFAFPERHKHIHDLPALEILYGDAHRHVICGNYPCTEDQAIYLAGISLQISQGDFNDSLHKPGYLKDQLQEFLPAWLLHTKHLADLEKKVLAQYAKISESKYRTQELLYKEYIKYCSRWPFYGSMYFKVQCTSKPAKLSKWQGRLLTLAINPKAIFLISRDPSVIVQVYHLDGLNWDVANEKQELQLTVPSTGESAVFKSKQILILKTALHKFMQIRVSSLTELAQS